MSVAGTPVKGSARRWAPSSSQRTASSTKTPGVCRSCRSRCQCRCGRPPSSTSSPGERQLGRGSGLVPLERPAPAAARGDDPAIDPSIERAVTGVLRDRQSGHGAAGPHHVGGAAVGRGAQHGMLRSSTARALEVCDGPRGASSTAATAARGHGHRAGFGDVSGVRPVGHPPDRCGSRPEAGPLPTGWRSDVRRSRCPPGGKRDGGVQPPVLAVADVLPRSRRPTPGRPGRGSRRRPRRERRWRRRRSRRYGRGRRRCCRRRGGSWTDGSSSSMRTVRCAPVRRCRRRRWRELRVVARCGRRPPGRRRRCSAVAVAPSAHPGPPRRRLRRPRRARHVGPVFQPRRLASKCGSRWSAAWWEPGRSRRRSSGDRLPAASVANARIVVVPAGALNGPS